MSFKQVHIDPDVFMVRVPAPGIAPITTNCFVVKDGADALVIDTGAPTDKGYEVLSSALRELDVEPDRTTFFLTHFHIDHVGLVDRIVPVEARLHVSRVDFEATLSSPDDAFARSVRCLMSEGVSAAEANRCAGSVLGFAGLDTCCRSFSLVDDGDDVSVGRYKLRVVGTPGHTLGHLSLYEPESRILFGGDHILFGISPSVAAFPDGVDGLQVYFGSLEKVRSLGCRKLFHSHGALRDDFMERIDWLKRHHLERLDIVVDMIAEEPGLTGEQITKGICWNVPFENWEDISSSQQWCILTEGAAILNHLVKTGRIVRAPDAGGVFHYEPNGFTSAEAKD